ncbi:hypothetical protein P3339_09440 [Microbulbifer sp. MLAF003]|uniref:hypothetical protein n=1 Tax=Microbulbifer sp. MLAF003 TaxID=3032582 RepID=UPI0024AE2BDF|nr:hypothetical protein [Microbulbifer sp. MLAF003]WHI52964.1 hypothetical protein P3339_09440 [Microbulbifer sp. MLAF003]
MSELGIRELLWEWSRAYPERAGDSISWPRKSAFAREMVSGHRESLIPVNEARAEETDQVVGMYLRAVKGRKSQNKAEAELRVFWLRYFRRWELQDVSRVVKKSVASIKTLCQIIESSIEIAFSMWERAK